MKSSCRIESLVLALLLLSVPFSAFAVGGQGSGGGNGIMLNNHLYLLDLVENGSEKNPQMDLTVIIDDKVHQRVQKALYKFPAQLQDGVARKLTELGAYDVNTREALLTTIELYQWVIISLPLPNVDDQDGLEVQAPGQLIQVAVRDGRTIRISDSYWSQLDPSNQVALIFHEIIYAMIPPQKIGDGVWVQSSRHAREIVGYLFDGSLPNRGMNGWDTLASGSLPYQIPAEPHMDWKEGLTRTFYSNFSLVIGFNYLDKDDEVDTFKIQFNSPKLLGPSAKENIQKLCAKASAIKEDYEGDTKIVHAHVGEGKDDVGLGFKSFWNGTGTSTYVDWETSWDTHELEDFILPKNRARCEAKVKDVVNSYQKWVGF